LHNIHAAGCSGSKTVCGECDSKNSYGGYGGFKYFVASTSNPFLLETDIDVQNWIKLCMSDHHGRLRPVA
jgi:hypothetical protein